MKRRRLCALAVLLLVLTGVGLSVAAEGDDHPNIIIENNRIEGPGLGIYLGWIADWHMLVRGNHFTHNAEAIRIVNRKAIIEDNVFVDNVVGIRVTEVHEEVWRTAVEKVLLRGNHFERNELYALQNMTDIPVLGDGNWWGDPDGPRTTAAPAPAAPAWHTTWVRWSLPELDLAPPLTLEGFLRAADDTAFLTTLTTMLPTTTPYAFTSLEGLHAERFIPQSEKEERPRMFMPNTVLGLLEYTYWLEAPKEGE